MKFGNGIINRLPSPTPDWVNIRSADTLREKPRYRSSVYLLYTENSKKERKKAPPHTSLYRSPIHLTSLSGKTLPINGSAPAHHASPPPADHATDTWHAFRSTKSTHWPYTGSSYPYRSYSATTSCSWHKHHRSHPALCNPSSAQSGSCRLGHRWRERSCRRARWWRRGVWRRRWMRSFWGGSCSRRLRLFWRRARSGIRGRGRGAGRCRRRCCGRLFGRAILVSQRIHFSASKKAAGIGWLSYSF